PYGLGCESEHELRRLPRSYSTIPQNLEIKQPCMILSVVIPTFNRCEVLRRTIPTVIEQDFASKDFEIIVVVDGSTDGTVDMLRNLHPPCALKVMQQRNRGQAVARNIGI